MVLKNKTRGQLNKDLLSQLVVCLFILHFFFSLLWEFVLKCTHTHTERPILVRSIKEGSIMFSGSWDNLKEEMSNYTYMNRHIYYILYINFYGSKEKRVARSWVNSLGCKTKRLSPTLACSNMLFFFSPFSLRENLWSWFAIVKLICGLREKKKKPPKPYRNEGNYTDMPTPRFNVPLPCGFGTHEKFELYLERKNMHQHLEEASL